MLRVSAAGEAMFGKVENRGLVVRVCGFWAVVSDAVAGVLRTGVFPKEQILSGAAIGCGGICGCDGCLRRGYFSRADERKHGLDRLHGLSRLHRPTIFVLKIVLEAALRL